MTRVTENDYDDEFRNDYKVEIMGRVKRKGGTV